MILSLRTSYRVHTPNLNASGKRICRRKDLKRLYQELEKVLSKNHSNWLSNPSAFREFVSATVKVLRHFLKNFPRQTYLILTGGKAFPPRRTFVGDFVIGGFAIFIVV